MMNCTYIARAAFLLTDIVNDYLIGMWVCVGVWFSNRLNATLSHSVYERDNNLSLDKTRTSRTDTTPLRWRKWNLFSFHFPSRLFINKFSLKTSKIRSLKRFQRIQRNAWQGCRWLRSAFENENLWHSTQMVRVNARGSCVPTLFVCRV